MGKKNDFQNKLDDFIAWMENDGMLGRWKRQRDITDVEKNRKKMNQKIRETKAINETMEELK